MSALAVERMRPSGDLTLRSLVRVSQEAAATGLAQSREFAEACWQATLEPRPLEALCVAAATKNKQLHELCVKEYFAGCLQFELASFLPSDERLPSDDRLEEAADNCARYIGSLFGACRDPYGERGGCSEAVRCLRSCGAGPVMQAHAALFQVTSSLIRPVLEVHVSHWEGREKQTEEEMSYLERTSKMQGLLFRVLPESTERLVAAVASMEGRECCDLCSEVCNAAAGRPDPDRGEDAWYCHRCWDEAFETSLEEAQASPYEDLTTDHQDDFTTDATEDSEAEATVTEEEREETEGQGGPVRREPPWRTLPWKVFRVNSLD